MKILKLLFTNPLLFTKTVYGLILRFYKVNILRDEFTIEVVRWFKDKGDEKLRLNYKILNEHSIVFDVGGYLGDFAHDINQKYNCAVYLFEPHPVYWEYCTERFANNEKVISLNYGLSNDDGEFMLSDKVDGSSFHNPNHEFNDGIKCKVKEFFSVMRSLNVKNIDLMKINIEGGEYPLLDHISKENRFDVAINYQIQFHNFIKNALVMRNDINDALSKTHKQTWCYPFVWENWEKI